MTASGVERSEIGRTRRGWRRSAARLLVDPLRPEIGIDFTRPFGEEALTPAGSVSWRVVKNPLALFAGEVAAVILELAEPRVRGAWEHTSFRTDPVRRLRHTAYAAMVTVYGPRRSAEKMIAAVRHRHQGVRGVTASGAAYHASDRELLNWVQATLSFGLVEAYHAYVRPLSPEEKDRFHAEGAPIGRLYGADLPPSSVSDCQAAFEAMRGRLEPSATIFEFLAILRRAPLLPPHLRPLQRTMIRGAVELLPAWVRDTLGLDHRFGLGPGGATVLRWAGHIVDRLILPDTPAAEACARLGLPTDYLFSGTSR